MTNSQSDKIIDMALELRMFKEAAAKVVADWHAHNRISPRKRVQWASLSALEQVINGESSLTAKESC